MGDTIAAVATPMARGAIGILRLSGPEAVQAASAVFKPASGRPLEDYPGRRLVYGTLYDREGQPIDQVLATYTRGPGSYTGEDTAELQCHGSPAVLTLGLEALFAQGVRQAGPGEFTRRAFLNGRLDLTQAEAVADLIDAETSAAVRQAAGQLSGALGRRVSAVYDALTDLTAHFCAVLDYPDEDIDPFRAETMEQALSAAAGELSALLATYGRGRQLVQGVPCAIVGRPNAGKSSLLNALVGYDRAIVTDIPGTTRDTIEEKCRLGGVLLRLIDTAGLRDTADAVERLGVERSRAALEGAGLALVLIDPHGGTTREDLDILEKARLAADKVIVVLTKSDLDGGEETDRSVKGEKGLPVVSLSAKTGAGLEKLEAAVAALFPQGEENWGELLTNARQAEAAGRALEAVSSARSALAAGMPADAIFSDVEAALDALGALTGRSVQEDVTDRIFSRFCVGK
ncbi:tRNA uridine-5-carboxymethylaminomethyl(34) synthesis GTPase MnmE [uncultured Pseudoflavonifractor sp.]|uniref:tRNA uridine-5-carboxymethylaminomethyl(34) synthesis GTPase MnmE n=1 Tax=uncultured Pseudoflavonifractor sp. TaxID=1221379 RepID=UPI0025CDCA81|nr:tRNA uridine-5-carboxymethylaminomethyl(34) synthesis GTPase MnmE [uncultured Pseudoflavonifractor sp.]